MDQVLGPMQAPMGGGELLGPEAGPPVTGMPAQVPGVGAGPPLGPSLANQYPRAKTPGKKDLGKLQAWAKEDIARWRDRDTAFQEIQDFWESPDPPKPKPGQEVVKLPDGRLRLNNVAGQIAGKPYVIDNTPMLAVPKESAQKVENALRHWDHDVEIKHAMGGNNPLNFDLAQCALMRGCLASRVTARTPNPEVDPWDFWTWEYQMADPANCYPLFGKDNVLRLTYRYQAPLGELLDDPALTEAEKVYKDKDLDLGKITTVYAQYAYNPRWDYHAVFTDEGFLKVPTKVGYMPWVFNGAAGAFYKGTDWDTSQGYVKQRYLSFLDAIKRTSVYIDKVTSMFMQTLAHQANPSVAVLNPQDPRQVDNVELAPGTRFGVTAGAISTMQVGLELQHYQTMLTLLQSRQDQGTVPPAAFGLQPGLDPMSALAQGQLNAGAAAMISPFIRAIELHKQLIYGKALDLFANRGLFGPDQALLVPPIKQPQPLLEQVRSMLGDPRAAGQIVGGWETLTPMEVQSQRPYITVTFNTLTNQELALIANTVAPLVNQGLLSRDTARGSRFLKIEDPQKEKWQVISEQAEMDPVVLKELIPIAMAQNQEQLEAAVWQLISSRQAQAPQGGNPGGGAPPAQVPPPGAETVPPGAMGAPTAPMSPEEELMMMMGGGTPGMGGAGMGGTPPPPPMTNEPMGF